MTNSSLEQTMLHLSESSKARDNEMAPRRNNISRSTLHTQHKSITHTPHNTTDRTHSHDHGACCSRLYLIRHEFPCLLDGGFQIGRYDTTDGVDGSGSGYVLLDLTIDYGSVRRLRRMNILLIIMWFSLYITACLRWIDAEADEFGQGEGSVAE